MVTLEAIEHVRLLDGLPRDVLSIISPRLKHRSFTAGQLIFQRGDPGTSMFMIERGTVAVTLTNEEQFEYTIATLEDGDVFGEMALLTGEPRSAAVRAVSDVQAVEVGQQEFNELVELLPELNTRLLKLLAQRLGRTSVQQQAEHLDGKEAIARLLSAQPSPETDKFLGESAAARRVNEAIESLAKSSGHVLIVGPAGTGKALAATLIHQSADDYSRPLYQLDCANPPPVARDTPHDSSAPGAEILTELAQEAALFGHEPGSAAYAKSRRKGYIELAQRGSIILENVEHLAPKVQARLIAYLRDQSPTTTDTESTTPNLRLLTTATEQIHTNAAEGTFSAQLLDLLSGDLLSLPPLRKRKKDILVLADHFLAHFSRKLHKDIRGFSDEARNALVDYEWPSNVHELRQVIDRAVAICRDDLIREEHIFLGVSPFSTAGALNLLRLPAISKVAANTWFPSALRIVTIPFFLALIAYTMFGPTDGNLANRVVWALWWPGLVLSVALSARSWCGYCPVSAFGDIAGKIKGGLLSVPSLLRRHGFWISAAGLVIILWSEHAAHMFTNAKATGLLLLAILGGAMLVGLLFGERVWCRHVCPLGTMLGQYSAISPVVLRSNNNVCASQCQTHDCIKDQGCPMGLHPSASETSQDCVLCMSCVRSCSHKAVRVDLRLPWQAACEQNKWLLSRALFAVLLVSIVLAVKLPATIAALATSTAATNYAPTLSSIATAITSGPFQIPTYAAVSAAFIALAFIASAPGNSEPTKTTFARCGYTYLPLAFAAFFNVYFREFVDHGHELLPTAIALIGLDKLIDPTLLTPNLATLKGLIPIVTLIGAAVSFHMLNRISTRYPISNLSKRTHQLILTATTLTFLLTL